MDVRLRAAGLALLAAGSLMTAQAQTPTPFVTIEEALETDGRSMSLPTNVTGVMTVTPCTSCEVKMLRSTVSTIYRLRNKPVSLADFRNAMAANSETYVTVLYAVKTNELLTVTASVDAPAAGSR
jgi:hypothetical protein